jgi:hypothetical protein
VTRTNAYAEVRIRDLEALRSGGDPDVRFWFGDPGAAEGSLQRSGLPWVRTVTVALAMNAVPTITFDIDTTYEEGIRLLDSTIFTVGNIVRVKLFTDDDELGWFHGFIETGADSLSVTPESVSGSISAKPIPTTAAAIVAGGGPTPSMIGVLQSAAESLGYQLEVGPGALRVASDVGDDFEFAPGTATGMDILSEVCSDYGLSYRVTSLSEGVTVLVDSVESLYGLRPEVSLVMRPGARIADPNVLPLLSISPTNASSVWQAASVSPISRGGYTADVTDEGDVSIRTVEPEQTEVPIGSEVMASPSPSGDVVDVDGVEIDLDPASSVSPEGGSQRVRANSQQPPVGERAQQRMLEARRIGAEEGFQADLVTFGTSRVIPGDTVGVSGASRRYSGTYFVNAATHVVTEGWWESTFSTVNRGLYANSRGRRVPVGGVNRGDEDLLRQSEGGAQ